MKRNITRVLIVYVVAFFLLSVNTACSKSGNWLTITFVNPDGSKTPEIESEVVNTDSSRHFGLMYRRELAEHKGMFFVFPSSGMRNFWMKNTYIELDMIFIDKDLKVVSVLHRVTPHTTTPRESEFPALYVLEVVGGKAKEWGIVKGSRVVTNGIIPQGL